MVNTLSTPTDFVSEIVKVLNNLYKIGVLQDIKNILTGVIRNFRNEGMYQVLSYETDLELMDMNGIKARFCKREKVKYLQNNVIAFQDQAWGDGKILVDYRCSPGISVDQHRSGFKTYILISLREVRSKGDIDNFSISWKIRNGFLKPTGFWGTEINHDTDFVRTQIMFPRRRPPQRITVFEKNRQRTTALVSSSIRQLPDGKWLATWEKSKPTLNEQYIMNWTW